MLICAPEWVEAFRCKLDSFGLADLVASFRRGGLPQILLWVLSGGLLSASQCLLWSASFLWSSVLCRSSVCVWPLAACFVLAVKPISCVDFCLCWRALPCIPQGACHGTFFRCWAEEGCTKVRNYAARWQSCIGCHTYEAKEAAATVSNLAMADKRYLSFLFAAWEALWPWEDFPVVGCVWQRAFQIWKGLPQ